MNYKGKKIFKGDISVGNKYREKYLQSINKFIEQKYSDSFGKRDLFTKDIVSEQENYRKRYMEMIGEPISPYPDYIPNAKTEYVGKDDFCDIYYLQIETMPDFWFYGVLMVPFGEEKTPLVIAQHGGGSNPEICSEFFGPSNYGYFTKKALERGFAVFAPQLLLWNFDIDTGEKKVQIDIQFDRGATDSKLKQLGISITGLEVFCIRRSIDYLVSLDYIDESRVAMMGLSYGGYFSIYAAAADKRIKSIYAAGVFNDRTKKAFGDWVYNDSANTFCDAEVAALCAPRRLMIDVGKTDPVFDFETAVDEGKRALDYYAQFNAQNEIRFNIWEGGHRFDESGHGFEFFFDGI